MTNARDEILAKLRQHKQDQPPVTPAVASTPLENPVQHFIEIMNANQAEATLVPSLDAALDALGDLLYKLGANRIVVNGDSPVNAETLAQRWPDKTWSAVELVEDIQQTCADADVGISGASVALAETGTIIVRSGIARSRMATLLPPVHIALVPASIVVADIHVWLAQEPQNVPSMVTLVSGPSKTADIEQELAIGVHGPCQLIVVVYSA